MKLDLRSARVEREMRFKAVALLIVEASDAPPKGLCERIDIYVSVDSAGSADVIKRMIETCEVACMGLQTAMNPVPARVNLVHET